MCPPELPGPKPDYADLDHIRKTCKAMVDALRSEAGLLADELAVTNDRLSVIEAETSALHAIMTRIEASLSARDSLPSGTEA